MQSGLKYSGIYSIRNTVSGRRYIGSAINIRQRWHSHRSLLLNGIHHSKTLLRSWLKHGETAFVFEVIEAVEDKSKLIEREQFWINEFNAADPKTGFNMSPTAGSCIGFRHSDATRKKMSRLRNGVPKSEIGKRNITEALVNKNKSLEMREKVRASKIAFYSNPENRKQLSIQSLNMWNRRRALNLRLGHPQSEETKRKLSIAKTGKMSEAHKAAIAASNRRRAALPAIHN